MNSIFLHSFPGRQFRFQNRNFLYFGGTSYLGMQTLPEFQSIFTNHVRTFGTNYGASRNSNIRLEIYERSENFLSLWVGSESSVSLSSGYLAGQLLAKYFNNEEYQLFYTSNTHSSLFLNDHFIFDDYSSLKKGLESHLESNSAKTPVIFLDTIDFSEEGFPLFEGLKSLPLESCIVVADDSHGIGLVGSNGSGSYQTIKLLGPKELLVCCSLGKSMGLQAGAIFGTLARISALKKNPLFSGASPASAAYMATLIEASPLYALQRSRLLNHIKQFLQALQGSDKFRFLEKYPVFAYRDTELTDFLFQEGICVTDFNYPSDKDPWQSRIVLSAVHHENDIQHLADLVNIFHS